jgi:hypothetical protein
MASVTDNPAAVVNGEDLHCFVCDVTVAGRFYTLATCRTQSTKIRLIEKLGQLVGERYKKQMYLLKCSLQWLLCARRCCFENMHCLCSNTVGQRSSPVSHALATVF